MIIGITGSKGFFGWHLRCRLFTLDWQFIEADRSTFADPDALDEFVNASDVVVHLAGVNRADTSEQVTDGNIRPAQALQDARKRTGARFDLIYANSIKAVEPSAYGTSKGVAGELLAAGAAAAGDRFVDIRFPHLFGEFGVPHYNSGITTFAHELVRGQPSIVNEGEFELIHVQDACQLILDAITKQLDQSLRPRGRNISVPDAYSMMKRLASYASDGQVPKIMDDKFELRLFNTIRSQMWPDFYPMELTRHVDDRGSFFEVVRAWGQGQTSISTTVPGITRGEHYHLDKVERFAVVSGQARIRVRRLFTDEILEFFVDGEWPVSIDMPPLCTHDITNNGQSELLTLFWSHDHFDPSRADTYPLPVAGEALPA